MPQAIVDLLIGVVIVWVVLLVINYISKNFKTWVGDVLILTLFLLGIFAYLGLTEVVLK